MTSEINTSRTYQHSYICTKQTLCKAHQPYAGHGGFNTPSAQKGVCCESEVSVSCLRTTWAWSVPCFQAFFAFPQEGCKKEGKAIDNLWKGESPACTNQQKCLVCAFKIFEKWGYIIFTLNTHNIEIKQYRGHPSHLKYYKYIHTFVHKLFFFKLEKIVSSHC